MAIGAKPATVLPTCMMKNAAGNTVVVNKSDRESYEKRGYEYQEDNAFAASPAAIADAQRAGAAKAAQQVEVDAAKADADNLASGGDTDASGYDDSSDDFDED